MLVGCGAGRGAVDFHLVGSHGYDMNGICVGCGSFELGRNVGSDDGRRLERILQMLVKLYSWSWHAIEGSLAEPVSVFLAITY